MNRQGRWTELDRILSLEPGQGAKAIRNVTNTLEILDSHFPRFPVMPGVLILGSMGELAALLLKEQTGRDWKLAGAKQVRYRHFVQPGDQMEINVQVKDVGGDTAVLKGDVSVDGKPVTTARELRMIPAGGG